LIGAVKTCGPPLNHPHPTRAVPNKAAAVLVSRMGEILEAGAPDQQTTNLKVGRPAHLRLGTPNRAIPAHPCLASTTSHLVRQSHFPTTRSRVGELIFWISLSLLSRARQFPSHCVSASAPTPTAAPCLTCTLSYDQRNIYSPAPHTVSFELAKNVT
jgi:hypothetical protein